ncbi:hypothetical protein Nepgr_026501 [Nepenthes gracilis]|uniref:Protein kinase domain-containing protein n=1 Tax=Nepenthes gracilis TaxID=150966 RepID=A0AAD3Y0M0_NEPGR|nr:hypothetical protein Nepgr_026501 [Nepenthes gracilis]
MIVVEFDYFPNPEWDPSFQHVGINNNSISLAVYTPWNASIHSRDTTDAWIIYNATTNNFSVFWSYRGAGPRRFSYAELASATSNFSNQKKLGEGGFGSVFKGYFIDLNMAVAVKKISSTSKQGKMQCVTEVKIICRPRHQNLVQLIGWCHESAEFILVYEFMLNGSLDAHLFGKKAAAFLACEVQSGSRACLHPAVSSRGVGAVCGAPRHQIEQHHAGLRFQC